MHSLTCVHTLYTNTDINTNSFFQMPSPPFVHTLYTNTDINTKDHCQNYHYSICTYPTHAQKKHTHTKVHCQYSQSYMCTYPIQQQKHKLKRSLPKFPVLHVDIPYTTKTKINKNTCFQKSESYIYTYPIQQQEHKHKD